MKALLSKEIVVLCQWGVTHDNFVLSNKITKVKTNLRAKLLKSSLERMRSVGLTHSSAPLSALCNLVPRILALFGQRGSPEIGPRYFMYPLI